MKIAISGASGFLGSRLSRRLQEGRHEVRAISRPMLGGSGSETSLRGILSDVDLLIDAAGLKASACDGDISAAIDANVGLTKALLDAAAAAGVRRFAFLSTYYVYGRQTNLPCSENAELHPVDAYGMTKALAEMSVRQSGINHDILRLGNIFGFDSAGAGREAVSMMTESALRAGVVNVFGEGRQTLDLLPAESFCAIIERLCETPASARILNVASGRPVSVRELAAIVADAVQRISGKPVCIVHKAATEHDPVSKSVTVELLQRLIGRIPAPQLDESVRSFVSAYVGCPVP